MTLFDLILLMQLILARPATISGPLVVTVGATVVSLDATSCATTAQAAWDDHAIAFDPYEVTATNTQSGDGCAQSSALSPSVSLP